MLLTKAIYCCSANKLNLSKYSYGCPLNSATKDAIMTPMAYNTGSGCVHTLYD